MILSPLSDQKARLLMRIRWLAWGAIAALAMADLAVALAMPPEPETPPHLQAAPHAGATCACPHPSETI
jgi:hypothetical protein